MWTRRPCRKASPAGRAGRGRVRGGRPGGTVPMCHEMSCFVMRGPCDVMRCHVCHDPPVASFPSRSLLREIGGRPAGTVPMCHEVSRDVMFCHEARRAAPSPQAVAEAPLSLSCMSSLHRISFRSRRRRFPGKRPFFARIACAPAPAFRAGAHIAHLIARAGKRKGARLPSVPLGFFSHRCEAEGESGPRMPLPPCIILPRIYRTQALSGIIS